MEKLKILCLHGYGTNKEFMKKQTHSFRRQFEKYAEFIFVDGPFITHPDYVMDRKVHKMLEGPPRSWIDPGKFNKTNELQVFIDGLTPIKQAYEQASPYYDGVLGFSQGSVIYQTIISFQQRKLINWSILDKVKFFINFSADIGRVSIRDIEHERFSIPSLHFLSQEDFLFTKCIINPIYYKDPVIIFHTFGHKFPKLGLKESQVLIDFLLKHGYGKKNHKVSIKVQQNSKL